MAMEQCLPWVVRSRDEEGVAGVGQDERKELVGGRGAGSEHDAVRVKPRLASPYRLHEARHCLPIISSYQTSHSEFIDRPARNQAHCKGWSISRFVQSYHPERFEPMVVLEQGVLSEPDAAVRRLGVLPEVRLQEIKGHLHHHHG
jgi:hypothetical protein